MRVFVTGANRIHRVLALFRELINAGPIRLLGLARSRCGRQVACRRWRQGSIGVILEDLDQLA